ncbi:MAG: ribonuclease III [Spirochaetota bacterium]|nr:ribonuclease III [Spirochaetota bacterium]
MDENRINELRVLQRKLNINFNNISLLHNAFLHSSYVNENQSETEDNEKLELLGDSVLAFVVNEHLYKSFSECSEGELSRIKSIVVSEHTLAGIARKLDLNQYLLLGRGEKQSQGMNRQAILADTFEALLGAYNLDSGIHKVREFILPFIIEEIEKINKNEHQKDYKTKLQLYTQKEFKECPIYETISEAGPDHEKTFLVQVLVNDKILGTGYGNSKKLAQQAAAKKAINKLKSIIHIEND